jgi:hypothetical protein
MSEIEYLRKEVAGLRELLTETIEALGETVSRVEALRLVLENHGISKDETDQKFAELQMVWQNAVIEKLKAKRDQLENDRLALMRQLLETHEGTKQ